MNLRFLKKKDGTKILQWVDAYYDGQPNYPDNYWQDVPMVEEEINETN